MRFFKDLSPAAVAAGFVAVLVGFTSSVALVFQAAQAFHATPEQITSWIWALGLGMGLCSLVPSLILRMPVMVAWSTRGRRCWRPLGWQVVSPWGGDRCLYRQRGPHHPGGGDRLVRAHHEPHPHGNRLGPAGRRAGQVRHAGFSAAETNLSLVLVMLRLSAFAAHGSALCGHHHLAGRNRLGGAARADAVVGRAGLAMPVYTAPEFSLQALISLALPLFVVTMASQNLPGVAVIRATGYPIPVSRVISMTGVATLLLAPLAAMPSTSVPSRRRSAWETRRMRTETSAIPLLPCADCYIY
jgi:benzoate membrane transport protein